MKKFFVIIFLFCAFHFSFSQDNPYKVLNEKEVNFLYNYYEQDGNHSPVTGGIGTEKLDCNTPLIQVSIPFDTTHNISVSGGLDYYTSASCNRIDRFITSASSQYLSSASSNDVRGHFDVNYTNTNIKKHNSKGVMFAFSNEFDVVSLSTGFHYSKSDKYENRQFNVNASFYYDIWKLIYPGEIRDGDEYRFGNEEEDYDSDSRLTSTLSLAYSQVVTKKIQFVISSDLVYQNGILNTPFHRVYFNDGLNIIDPDTNYFLIAKTMKPESLPRTRYKIPISLRINCFLTDFLITRFYYRFYYDDFGILAHTFSAELPIKIASWLTIYPLYRYHKQTASKYFAEFGMHELDLMTYQPISEFYTSDYDLSAFTTHKFGGGFRISPIYGISKLKIYKTLLIFKSIEFRYSNYNRSDGLKSNSYSFDVSFVF